MQALSGVMDEMMESGRLIGEIEGYYVSWWRKYIPNRVGHSGAWMCVVYGIL